EKCMELFPDNILFVSVKFDNKVIAMGFYFIYESMIHAHLSGTLSDYLELSPAYILKYATVEWAESNNIKLIHYGGGTTNNSDDPLFKFKRKFTKETLFSFHIGKKIWNEEIYNQLCLENNVNKNVDFFPAYRYE